MLPVKKEELKPHQDAKVCYICGKSISKSLSKCINYQKVRDHCHYTKKFRGTAHSVPNEMPVVFHND